MKKCTHSKLSISAMIFVIALFVIPLCNGCTSGNGSTDLSYYNSGGSDSGATTTPSATTSVSCSVELPTGSAFQPADLSIYAGSLSSQVLSSGSTSASLSVSSERAQLLTAVDKNGSPVLLAINIPNSKSKSGTSKLSAASTALALVYLSPLVCQADAAQAETIYNLLINLPEMKTLSNLISSKMASGKTNILTAEDSEIENAMGDVLTAYYKAINKTISSKNKVVTRTYANKAGDNPVFYVTVSPAEAYGIKISSSDNKISIINNNAVNPVYMYMDNDQDLPETLLEPGQSINVTITGYAGNSKTLKVMGWGAYGDYPSQATARDKELIDSLRLSTIKNGVVNGYNVATGSISDKIKSAGEAAVNLFKQENPSDPNGTSQDDRTLGKKLGDYLGNNLPDDLKNAGKWLGLIKEKCPAVLKNNDTEKDVLSSKFLQKFTISCTAYPDSVAAPTFSPAGGSYTSAQTITLATTTEGAEIYYLVTVGAGSEGSFTKYTAPFQVSKTSTVYAYAKKTGMTDSETKSATYTIGSTTPENQVAAPTFSPAGGTYTSAQTITLTTTTQGSEIYYSTTSASGPWTKYASDVLFQVSTTTTVYAYAKKTGMTDSSVASATYTISSSGGTGNITESDIVGKVLDCKLINEPNGFTGSSCKVTVNSGGTLTPDVTPNPSQGKYEKLSWTLSNGKLILDVNFKYPSGSLDESHYEFNTIIRDERYISGSPTEGCHCYYRNLTAGLNWDNIYCYGYIY